MTNPLASGDSKKNKKTGTRVKKINGLWWRVDEEENPIKRVSGKIKRKSAGDDEIDDTYWQIDVGGNPIEKAQERSVCTATTVSSLSTRSEPTAQRKTRPMINNKQYRRSSSLQQMPSSPSRTSRSMTVVRNNQYRRSASMKQLQSSQTTTSAPSKAERKAPTKKQYRRSASMEQLTIGSSSRKRRSHARTGKLPKDVYCERSRRSESVESPSSSSAQKEEKPLPKNVREIDGELWRIDENGNKIKKVRRVSSSKAEASMPKTKSTGAEPSDSQQRTSLDDLQKQLRESRLEASRLSKIAKKQKAKLADKACRMKRMERELKKGADEKQQISRPDHLIDEMEELKNENCNLMGRLGKEKALAESRLMRKEEELRFLQEELKRMRIHRDELNFEKRAMTASTTMPSSLQMVEDVWKRKRSVDDAALKSELEALRERVDGLEVSNHSLQLSNNKLKQELEEATLMINDQDDDEIRKAKEIAKTVAHQGLTRRRRQSVHREVFVALNKEELRRHADLGLSTPPPTTSDDSSSHSRRTGGLIDKVLSVVSEKSKRGGRTSYNQ